MSLAEENYLKALYHLIFETEGPNEARTSELASLLKIRPASVNDMLKKMKEKGLIANEKYGKIKLTESGKMIAVNIIRKHRLWETFLYEKLDFTFIEDLAKGCVLAGTKEKGINQTFNITYGKGQTLYSYVMNLKKFFHVKTQMIL